MSTRLYLFGPFRLDAQRLLLCVDGVPLALGPKVAETLLALVERAGEVLSKSELLDRIWPEGFVEEANLAQNVYVLRKVLRAHWAEQAIVTLPRRGYRFVAPVAVEAALPSALPAAVRKKNWRQYGAAAAMLLAAAMAASMTRDRAQPFGATRARAATLSPAAARFYAIGRYYWDQRTASGLDKSIAYFQKVVAVDPQNARGYASLAQAYALMGDYMYGPLSMRAWYARARSYAAHALALDPQAAEAHAAMGIALDLPGSRQRAEREYRRAILLDPGYAPAHQWYGTSLLRSGRIAPAFKELQRAAQLDPVSVAATAWLSEAAYFSRRYTEAIALARQTIDLSPQRRDAYVSMGLAFEASHDYRHAVDAFTRFGSGCRKCEGEAAALLAHAYAVSHDWTNAAAQLTRAERASHESSADPEDVAIAMVAMGRRADALRMLHESERKRIDPMLALDPRMDAVRTDPRFRAYMRARA